MKTLIFFLIFLVTAGNPGKGKIVIVVECITSGSGNLMVGLFDAAKDFTVNPVISAIEPIRNESPVTVEFRDVPHKKYAISVYQDLNNNRELDKNGLGIPVEPYGFSNNPVIITGPSFEKSSFEFKEEELKIIIKLH